MGHTRLGSIPKSKKWNEVVDIFVSELENIQFKEDKLNKISTSTIRAAQNGLDEVMNDEGLQYSFYLLSQLILKSKSINWYSDLSQLGLNINEKSSALDLQIELHSAIDDYCEANNIHSDIREIAQKSVGITLSDLVLENSESIFGDNAVDVKVAMKKYSTVKGFSEVGQKFFGSFLTQYLNFYLSRISASVLGHGVISNVNDISSFNKSFENHCYQSAKIIKQFTGEWISKTEYEQGINQENISRFIAVSIKKIQSELGKQEVGQ